ncbi:19842_t:CDS:2 [Funneliformis geosporum]|uniref:19842_t:CDS:1 n=1 Tax=Funneliformis geosporum TaxID=1117311 RepID=A0A9W4SXY4_9GLOM|nr:19842_t:CDS:2 [Funneliformis geosporum]
MSDDEDNRINYVRYETISHVLTVGFVDILRMLITALCLLIRSIDEGPETNRSFTNQIVLLKNNRRRFKDISISVSELDIKLTTFHEIYLQDDCDLRDERKLKVWEMAFQFMGSFFTNTLSMDVKDLDFPIRKNLQC